MTRREYVKKLQVLALCLEWESAEFALVGKAVDALLAVLGYIGGRNYLFGDLLGELSREWHRSDIGIKFADLAATRIAEIPAEDYDLVDGDFSARFRDVQTAIDKFDGWMACLEGTGLVWDLDAPLVVASRQMGVLQ